MVDLTFHRMDTLLCHFFFHRVVFLLSYLLGAMLPLLISISLLLGPLQIGSRRCAPVSMATRRCRAVDLPAELEATSGLVRILQSSN